MRTVPSIVVLVSIVALTFGAQAALGTHEIARWVVLFLVAASVSALISTGRLFSRAEQRED